MQERVPSFETLDDDRGHFLHLKRAHACLSPTFDDACDDHMLAHRWNGTYNSVNTTEWVSISSAWLA